MFMSIQEVADKLNNMLKHADVKGDMLVKNTYVVQEDDTELLKEYSPGTVLFDLSDEKDKLHWCQLSLYPEKVSKWLN